MLASSTVYTVVTRLVIRVPSTADDDTGRLHCLPSGFDTVRSTVYTIGPSTTQHGLCDPLSQRGSPWWHGIYHCLPRLAAHRPCCVLRATPDGVDSRGGEYCVRCRDLCLKHRTFFAAYFEPVCTIAESGAARRTQHCVTCLSWPSEGRHDGMGCIAVYPCLAPHRPCCVLRATPDGFSLSVVETCV